MIQIAMTYSVVTPESAEDGDTADHGFAEPGGWRYSIASEAFHARCEAIGRDAALKEQTPEPLTYDSVNEAIRALRHSGPFEASCSPLCDHAHCWLTESEGTTDYTDGSVTTLSYHVTGPDAATVRAVLDGALARTWHASDDSDE